jgi:hypothetical protein
MILSKEYHWAGKLLRQLRQGFPKLDRGIEKAPSSAERPLGVAKTKGLRIKSFKRLYALLEHL